MDGHAPTISKHTPQRYLFLYIDYHLLSCVNECQPGELLHTGANQNITVMAFCHSEMTSLTNHPLAGPDHMALYLSPHDGVSIVASSVGSLVPIVDHDGSGRVFYFIYYSHGVDPGQWEFWLEFAVSWSTNKPKTVCFILFYSEEGPMLPWSQRFSFAMKRREKREKEAATENLWLRAMQISLTGVMSWLRNNQLQHACQLTQANQEAGSDLDPSSNLLVW